MENYKKLNILFGWLTFLIATVVYFMTLEPTASWWDCGEYIATAYKLQVGHPPGAPFFQLLGRFFSLFAFGDTSKVALMINSMSALSSSFTILFLFWTITALAKKLVTIKGAAFTSGKMYAVLGAGLVGALAYTFSDSFWFSAVEGEVYAMSSLFTAITFWAIVKWDQVADEPHSFRWLIFIAYLIGVSIGVHLLNLLAIPAIAYVYYFKKHKPNFKGILITGIVSVILLAFIMYGVIPEIVNLFGKTELLFVNTFGMPFNSGTIFFAIILIAAVVLGILYTHDKLNKKQMIGLYASISVLALLILVGNSSMTNFFMRLILLGAVGFGFYYLKDKKVVLNTILLSFVFLLIGYSSFLMIIIRSNANTPINENAPKDAVSLLSYLNREQYGSTPLFSGQYYNSPVVDYGDKSPVYIKDTEKGNYKIADKREGIVPIFDSRFTTLFPRMWSRQKPSHVQAYKDWAGVEGKAVSYTDKYSGETKTIVKPTFFENLTFFFRYQVGHMYMRYFMWNFAGRQNDIQGHGGPAYGNWISGIGLFDDHRVGTLDDLPESMQSHAMNKFYFLPLILGLIGLLYQAGRRPEDSLIVFALFFMTGLAIVMYLNQPPYQPRERDYAYAGSFYAFAIWIGLGVLSLYELLNKALKKHRLSAIGATLLGLGIPLLMGAQGWDDHNRSGKYVAKEWGANYLRGCDENAILITHGDNDTFPLWYAQEVEGIRKDVRVCNHMLASGDWYIHQMKNKVYDSDPLPLQLTKAQYLKGTNDQIPVADRGIKGYSKLKDVIDFVSSNKKETQYPLGDGTFINYIPTPRVRIPVDKEKVLANGLVPPEMADRIVPYIEWTITEKYLYKNDLMMLDLLANFNWDRPLYIGNPGSLKKVADIEKYCHQEGVIYKFMPVLAEGYVQGMAGVSEKSYDILLNKYNYGRVEVEDVIIDTETRRAHPLLKTNFVRLAGLLAEKGKADSAARVLDKCVELFPNEKFPYDYYTVGIADIYFEVGENEKGAKLVETMLKIADEKLSYYNRQDAKLKKAYEEEIYEAFSTLQRLRQLTMRHKQSDLEKKVEEAMELQLSLFK